ncbi:MAG: Ig-like domain-containing protein [Bacilli bacterium]
MFNKKAVKIAKIISYALFVMLAFLFTFCSFSDVSKNLYLLNRENSVYASSVTKIDYQNNDLVEVIVELDDNPIIDSYDEKYAGISAFLSSTKGYNLKANLENKQQEVIEKITDLNIYADFDNSYSYQVIMNAISVKTYAKNLSKIKDIVGVKDVYISNYYEPYELTNSEYQTYSESEMISYVDSYMNSDEVANLGYTGKGTSVAVLDTGMDTTHLGFANDVEDPKFTKESLDALIQSTTLNAKGVVNANAVYYSSKIPYAFDYADNDNNVYNYNNQHGMHVAGIVGANAYLTRGVAKDTQIFAMKVFSDVGNAFDTYIFAALEDCVKLDVDVINMSLGSACGSSYVTGRTSEVYDKLQEYGINIVVAAGNEHAVGIENAHGNNLPLASAPDYGLVSSPSTYFPSLSVASLENKTLLGTYLKLGEDTVIPYTETTTTTRLQINNCFNDTTQELVLVPGYGKPSDYDGINVEGKIALVARGEITFEEKHNNAYDAGASAIIVYNPLDETFISMQIDEIKIPAVFIQKSSFDKIMEDGTMQLSFSVNNYGAIPNYYAGQLSSFSSYGTTRDLEIKPEITGPGGYIYSTVYDNQYAEYSGTSMSAPNIAGLLALITQYLNEKYPNISRVERVDLANTLIMETAVPAKDFDGNYYSVRGQGAGVADGLKAVTTNGIITVENQVRPKAELGSSEAGEFSYKFTISNIGNTPITYNLNTVTITDNYEISDGIAFSSVTTRTLASDEVIITYSDNVIGNSITVAGQSDVTVTVNIKVTDKFKLAQDPIFTNGSYVEGYTFLETDTDADLVIPYLGFYGDFNNLPIFEGVAYYDEEDSYNITGCFAAIFDATTNGYELGFDPVNQEFYQDKIYFSSNNMKGNYLTSINGLFRNVDYLKVEIFDESNELIYENTVLDYKKTFYLTSSGGLYFAVDINGWQGTLPDGSKVRDGETYRYVTTAGIYEYGTTNEIKSESWEFTFKIDSTNPSLESYQIITQDGKDYLEVTVSDNMETCSVAVFDYNITYQLTEEQVNLSGEKTNTFLFSLEDIMNSINENNCSKSQIKLAINDWANNFIYETITIGPSAIKTDATQKVAIGGKTQLNITTIPTTIDKSLLTFTSADERIAKVDQNGVVTGVSAGTTTITVKAYNGTSAEIEVVVGGSVDQSITITTRNFEMKVGETKTLKVIFDPLDTVDTSIKWTSSNNSVATVSKYGYVEALKPGKTTIKAVSSSGNIDKIEITVVPQPIEYIYLFAYQTTCVVGYVGKIGNITIIPEVENYDNLVFTSSNEKVIKVFSDGTMEAVGVGKATITVSSLDGSKSCSVEYVVTSVNPINIDIEKYITLSISESYQLEPIVKPLNTTDKTLKYQVNNEEILTVSETGLVTPVRVGTTYITITCGSVETNVYICITPVEITNLSSDEQFIEIEEGSEKVLNLIVTPSNATYQDIIYTSSNSDVVKVINGTIKALKAGTSTIKARSLNGIEYSFFVYVKPKQITNNDIDFTDITIKEGNSFKLEVKQEYLDKITFRVNSDEHLIISNNRIYALNKGTEVVEVLYNNEVIDTFNVSVTNKNGCANANVARSLVINFMLLSSILYFTRKMKH